MARRGIKVYDVEDADEQKAFGILRDKGFLVSWLLFSFCQEYLFFDVIPTKVGIRMSKIRLK